MWYMKTPLICFRVYVIYQLPYMGITLFIRVSQKYHEDSIWMVISAREWDNKLVPVQFVIYIDTHCRNLHQHKPRVAGRPHGCDSAISPCFTLQLSCTGFQEVIVSVSGFCIGAAAAFQAFPKHCRNASAGPRKSLVCVKFWKMMVRFLKNKMKMKVTLSNLGDVFLCRLY